MRQKFYSIGAGCALLLLATAAQAQYFKGMDLGGPAEAGSFTDNGGGQWTITGGGGDIWNNSDQCYYYYAWASGTQWVATVQCTDLQGPDQWTKAELMVRWSDPNLGPQADDGFIGAMATRAAGQNQLGPQYRPSRAAGPGSTGATGTPSYPNQWLRLSRTNSIFTISFSSDGVTFGTTTTIDTSSTANSFGTPWPNLVTVGLAVTSHNNNGGGNIGTAQFSGLNVTFPAVTPPTVIGAATQVTDTSVYPGSAATFTFMTTNNANPPVVGGGYVLYQWYKNGTAIPNATATSYSHLVNPSDSAENGAKYSCTATIQPPYNTSVTGMNSATGTLSVLPGAVYYTNGLKQEFFSGGNRVPVEQGNIGQATRTTRLAALDSSGGLGDNYTTRNSGWFIPPTTDYYVFFLACDDDSDLFVSTDNNPANKRLVAQQEQWSPTRSWLATGAGSVTQTRSDSWSPDAGATFPYAGGIPLTAGVPVYLELVHHNGGGGDNYGVTYQTTNQIADPNWPINFTNGAPSLMTSGLVLITGPTTTLTWSQQPTNTSVSQGNSTTFYAQAITDSEISPLYQWYRNGSPVAGATGTSWSTGATTPANNGDSITVVASTVFGGFSITSSPATLTVISAVRENGWAKVEFWSTANRAGIENGTAGNPTYVYAAPAFEANVNNVNRSGNARRLSGYFIAPATDDYVFFVNSDDDSDLFLSTDNTAANKRLIAQETGWSNPRQWTAAGSGTVTMKRSDLWAGTSTNGYANGIHLIANQQYYIEQVQANGGGGDNAQVTYKKIADGDPALGSASAINGSVISSFAPRCNWVAFTQQPTNPPAVASSAAGTVSFYAAGMTDSQTSIGTVNDGTPAGWPYVTFQWQKNGVDIPGAITGTYSLSSPFLPSDNGAVFTCKLRALGYADNSLNPIWSNSTPAVLTVVTNTPHFLYSAIYTNDNVLPFITVSAVYVTLAFDSPMDPGLLSLASTYTLGGGLTIVSINVNSNDYRSVTLEVSGTPTFPFSVTLNSNVSGLSGGAKVANTTLPVKTIPLTCQDIGIPGVDPAVAGTIVATGTNAYSISCEGSDIWNASDGFNFTYETKTGDFDVVVRQKDTKHTSNWAKGGLMVREFLDYTSRNWNIVNDPLASDGIQAPDGSGMGASLVECNRRATTFGNSDGWGIIGTQPAPAFPNAWVRLKRTGDNLSAYYSTSGLTWTLLATNNPTLVGDMTPLPATVYVGICVTAHNNDPLGTPPNQLRFLNTANFADYDSNYVPPASLPPATLTTSKSGNNLNISWTPAGGHLESSPALGTGALWTTVGTANPASVPIGTGNQYFRVVSP